MMRKIKTKNGRVVEVDAFDRFLQIKKLAKVHGKLGLLEGWIQLITSTWGTSNSRYMMFVSGLCSLDIRVETKDFSFLVAISRFFLAATFFRYGENVPGAVLGYRNLDFADGSIMTYLNGRLLFRHNHKMGDLSPGEENLRGDVTINLVNGLAAGDVLITNAILKNAADDISAQLSQEKNNGK